MLVKLTPSLTEGVFFVLPLQLGSRRVGDVMMVPLEVAGRQPAHLPVRPDNMLQCRSSKAGTIATRRAQLRNDDLALFESSWTEKSIQKMSISA